MPRAEEYVDERVEDRGGGAKVRAQKGSKEEAVGIRVEN